MRIRASVISKRCSGGKSGDRWGRPGGRQFPDYGIPLPTGWHSIEASRSGEGPAGRGSGGWLSNSAVYVVRPTETLELQS